MRSFFIIPSLLLIALCVQLAGCYDEDLEGIDLGYDYFPTELGTYVVYEVDSMWQDDPIGPIGSGSLSYVLHDLNESVFVDEGGRDAIRVERTMTSVSPMRIKVWSRVLTEAFAEQNEFNVIFLKHNFPVREGKRWQGHDRTTPQSVREYYGNENIPAAWEFQYIDVDQPYSIGALTFDSTVTVVQIDRPAIAGVSLYAKEVYAKHVGMIHRLVTLYNIQGIDSIGYTWEMRAIDFGQ